MSLEAVETKYTPWSNVAEKGIKELEKKTDHKLLWSRAPKHLQDYCIELEACIRSNTIHDIYIFEKEVSKTVMTDETSNISQFCKLELFK